jgi:hypothetical protein
VIPLRTSEPIPKLPKSTPVLISIFVLISLFAKNDLSLFEFHSNKFDLLTVVGLFVFPSVWSLFVGVFYLWAFTPRVFLSRSLGAILLICATGLWATGWSFSKLQQSVELGFFLADAIVGILLGMFMRGDIWGQMSTLVVGLGWIRVLDVPSYVLLFFWMFYQLIGMLVVQSPYSELRMVYWIPFFSFGWGFLAESLLRLFQKHENRTPSAP